MPQTDTRALACKVWTDSNASLATLTTSINAFLAGAGTPVLLDTNQLIDLRINSDGTTYFAYVLYSG